MNKPNQSLCKFDRNDLRCSNSGTVLYYIKEFFLKVYDRLDELEGFDLSKSPSNSVSIERFDTTDLLPEDGIQNTIYVVGTNVANVHLKFWYNGSYHNAFDRKDIPNCLSTFDIDFYAAYDDIDLSKYGKKFRRIVVLMDENNNNKMGYYLFDGTDLVESFLL